MNADACILENQVAGLEQRLRDLRGELALFQKAKGLDEAAESERANADAARKAQGEVKAALEGLKSQKAQAVAKAKAVAPDVPALLGSTPATPFRGNPDIFGRLVEDHDRHRALLAMIDATHGKSPERKRLFKELVLEIKGHAAASASCPCNQGQQDAG